MFIGPIKVADLWYIYTLVLMYSRFACSARTNVVDREGLFTLCPDTFNCVKKNREPSLINPKFREMIIRSVHKKKWGKEVGGSSDMDERWSMEVSGYAREREWEVACVYSINTNADKN